MSLQRNLIATILAVLLASSAIGAALTYWHAVAKVRTELQAAVAVGRRIVQNAADDGEENAEPLRRLGLIVGGFNGDRHLRAILRDPRGRDIRVSTLQPPADAAPKTVFDLVSGTPIVAAIDLPPRLRDGGTLVLETDAHNEVSEAWGDLKLELGFLGASFCLVLVLALRTLHAAFRPMQDISSALQQVGTGNYGVRLAFRRYRELAAVQDGFYGMTLRLAEVETQNRLLQTRLRCIQEDERRELARDLHDEVAPFLFAVSADAALIGRFVQEPNLDSLVQFWQSRQPDVTFAVDVSEDVIDNASSAVVFRIVQESLSNAMRHGDPSRVAIAVRHAREGIEVEVTDDGRGMPGMAGLPRPGAQGVGLLGMRERVRSIGGMLHVGNRTDRSGVCVHAILMHAPGLALS